MKERTIDDLPRRPFQVGTTADGVPIFEHGQHYRGPNGHRDLVFITENDAAQFTYCESAPWPDDEFQPRDHPCPWTWGARFELADDTLTISFIFADEVYCVGADLLARTAQGLCRILSVQRVIFRITPAPKIPHIVETSEP